MAKTITADTENGEAWMGTYPAEHHDMLRKYGVPTWMDDHADLYNRRLITLVETGCTDEAEFAALAEQSFNEHFGGMLAAWANEAAVAAGQTAGDTRHVDLEAPHQVSIANGIGHLMSWFRKREVAAVMGFTMDARGAIRLFGGGKAEENNLRRGVEYLRSVGIQELCGGTPLKTIDASGTLEVSPTIGHTRDRREQQAAVARVVRDVRHRQRDSEIEAIVGFTIDSHGQIHPFGGGETEGRLLEAAIDAMKNFIHTNGEKRYDH